MQKNQNTIRPATTDDIPAIAEVRYEAIRHIEPVYYDQPARDEWAGAVDDRIQKLLSDTVDVRLVAERDGQIIGYGEVVTADNLLGACYVSPAVGGQGVGRAIVAELERMARERGLDHLQMESSANAEKFYAGCGYRVTERVRHTMSSGSVVDSVMMRKDFSE